VHTTAGESGGTKHTAAEQRWQSDIIVDLLQRYGLPYVSLNPGASFRGLHDSLINYGGDKPKMLLCPHEEIAVQIAHGYAKAAGRPMAAILHDLVGLLHANLAVYYAYIDRAPVFIIGATGPMDESKRRPHIDWSHTALVQGEAIRNYIKWDYQPTAIDGVPDSFARAYSIMLTQPQGPVYMCYDAMLQEEPLTRPVPLPPGNAAAVPAAMAADPETLAAIADRLLSAEFPLLLAEYVGRSPGGFEKLVALETVGAPVWDIDSALNFPNRHALNLTGDDEALGVADVILGLDVRDWEKPTTKLDSTNRRTTSLVRDSCEWMEIGFGELNISKWSMDYGRLQPCTIRALGDPALAVPELTRLCRRRIDGDAKLATRVRNRAADVGKRHDALVQRYQEKARADWDASPITLPRLAAEVWQAIEHEDWVLTAGTLRSWARKLWNFDQPYRHPGKSLGTATQIGISLGVALAHKGTGRLVVDLQPDGDLMFDAGALWVAAKHEIPMLVVMFNNRAYYNDWEHQARMARKRGTDVGRAHIGMDLFGPAPDFAGLARSMGCCGEGPIERPQDIAPALRRAIAEVKKGRLALVDTVTQHR
jgi:acetolactate synthase-1/2/3 large subunit